jgi:U3 small nucleolar RNA-associated protein 14
MARRVSRPASSSAPAKPINRKAAHRKTKRSGLRKLDAFAIASKELPDETNVRAHRLGQREDSPESRKRRRQADQEAGEGDEGESEDEAQQPRKRRLKDQEKNGDFSEGSDDEGNTWRLGHVGEDDDSELDSDEAFDSDDEKKFAGWALSGSSTTKAAGKKSVKNSGKKSTSGKQMDLHKDAGLSEDSDDDSLGEDAVDLAQMLDDYEESDDAAEEAKRPAPDSSSEEDDEESEKDDEQSQFSGFSEEDEDDDDAVVKSSKLQSLISSMHPAIDHLPKQTAQLYESTAPTAAGPTSKEKFDINSLLTSTSDPNLASLIKKVGNVPKELKRDPKLAPALPRRQQDKLDRAAASKLTGKALERWVDSIKHMRRAEHLTFPLANPDSAPTPGSEHQMPAITSTPLNALENTINNILQESGLAQNDDEEDGFDALPENKISMQEILERRTELRRARELMFQEERRSKRIKKIKSKAYRRVHRKERERRLAALEADEDSDMDEEDREAHDRKRAEERMGTKHKDSKWAKQMKKAGRTVWDDDARSGVVEMARRNEELRRRISGKEVHGEDEETSSSDDDSDDQFKLRKLNGKLNDLIADGEEKHSGLASLEFMKRAEQGRKAENEAALRRIKRELAGEDSSDAESGDENVGRKLFGPRSTKVSSGPHEIRNEFEELDSDEHDAEDDVQPLVDPSYRSTQSKAQSIRTSKGSSNVAESKTIPSKNSDGSKKINSKSSQKISKPLDADILPGEVHTAPDTDGWVTVSYDNPGPDEDDDADSVLSQSEILKRAFAGDDFEDQFEKEKAGVVEAEDEQIIDDTLEGWGTWAGEGISKREQKRNQAIQAKNKHKFVTKKEGIKPQDRKDAKLKSVIVSQKRIKGNAAFLASTLPFPFKTRAEYERSIRMPVGGEWNVTQSVQENIKPKVMVKPGRVVEPMSAPIL